MTEASGSHKQWDTPAITVQRRRLDALLRQYDDLVATLQELIAEQEDAITEQLAAQKPSYPTAEQAEGIKQAAALTTAPAKPGTPDEVVALFGGVQYWPRTRRITLKPGGPHNPHTGLPLWKFTQDDTDRISETIRQAGLGLAHILPGSDRYNATVTPASEGLQP